MKPDFDHGGNVFAIARSLGVQPEDILDFSARELKRVASPNIKISTKMPNLARIQ